MKRRMVARLLAHSRYLLVLIFMLNTALNVLLQNVASNMFEVSAEGWVYKVGVPLALILIFGEFLPKYLGMLTSEKLAVRAAPIFLFLEKVLGPIQRLITSWAETISRIFFFFLKSEPPFSPKELEEVIEACETQGVLAPEEALLIRRSLEFEEKEARELMTPRSEMSAIKQRLLTKDAIVAYARGSPTSSILVIDETLDRPLGVMTSHEALLFQAGDTAGALASAAQKLFFVPEAMPATRLLQEFAERRTVMACVTDEHGTISGFIDEENMAKTVLGFVQKKVGLVPTTDRMQQKSVIVPGTTPIDDVNTLFQTALESEHSCSTIGGWLVEKFDGIPPTGTSYVTDEFIFRVLLSDDKMIKQLYIQKRGAARPDNTGRPHL